MIKPFTCLCMLAAAGSLMVLYQGKHNAQLLDREIAGLMKATDQIRERTGLARAEYAMLNDPERLAQLAGQYLQLQSLAPTQFTKLNDLASRLPATVAVSPEPEIIDEEPAPTLVAAAPAPLSAAIAAVPPPHLATLVEAPRPIMAAARSAPKPKPVIVAVAAPPRPAFEPSGGSAYAPILPAFASQPTRQEQRSPMLQRASASTSPAPFVGSALGMARTPLAAPVPFGSATTLGAATGQ